MYKPKNPKKNVGKYRRKSFKGFTGNLKTPVRSKPKGKPKGGKGKSASKSTISKVMKAAKDARNAGLAGSSLPNTFSDLMKEEKKISHLKKINIIDGILLIGN